MTGPRQARPLPVRSRRSATLPPLGQRASRPLKVPRGGLAATYLKCLTADDWAVRLLGLPSVAFTGEEAWYVSRGTLAAAATAVGFVFANIFCWLMNRWFVFRPGKFKWYVELGMFFGASTLATVIALGVMKFLIDQFGMMTTLAVVVEVVVSFFVNFFIRKFFIFKG